MKKIIKSNRLLALILTLLFVMQPLSAATANENNDNIVVTITKKNAANRKVKDEVVPTINEIEILESGSVKPQDDFYDAVNYKWLQTATIPAGFSKIDTFTELYEKTEEQIRQVFDELLKNQEQYDKASAEKNMINFYNNFLNMQARNKQGIEPLKPFLNQIKSITNMNDLDEYLSDIAAMNIGGIIEFDVSEDWKNSSKLKFYIDSTSLILGDADYYTKESDNAKLRRKVNTKYLTNMLVLAGYGNDEAVKMVQDAFNLESKIAPAMIGQEEANKDSNLYEKLYNVYKLKELDKLAPNLKLKSKIKNIAGWRVRKVIVTEPKWLKAVNDIYVPENLDSIKNYLQIKFISTFASTLSQRFIDNIDECNKMLTGVQGKIPEEQQALNAVNSVFPEEIGRMYVEKFFPKEAKADVEELVEEVINNYKKKLANVDWMSEATKKNAIKKLDKMQVKVGYPDKWGKDIPIELRSFEEGGSLFENQMELMLISYEEMIAAVIYKVDKSEFAMSPQTVNACYNPSWNDITFPAAILQPPFYDINSSREANMGSIGVIIGHEISHAFDTTGSHFDANGNLNMWWTPEDYKKFEERANKVRTYYSSVTTDRGNKVNGDLTVGENIADITGMSCSLDIMKTIPNAKYNDFFQSWATVWRSKTTLEAEKLSLEQDPHSPNKSRANCVVKQFQEFYDTYNVQPNDNMYLAPEERVQVY